MPMLFINPIEILELQSEDISAIDDNLIKKAKKKLMAEIELSDEGYLNYKGIKVTKSDCENAIDELNNKEKKEFFYYLATSDQLLNNYLVNGDERIFSTFRHQSIYKEPYFINFISPSFAYQFDRSMLKAFNKSDSTTLTSILRTQFLINRESINMGFKSVSMDIQNRITEVDKIIQRIKEGQSEYDDGSINETIAIIEKNFPIGIINSLPNYFQSQINKIGASINYLQLAIWDSFGNSQIPFDLLSYLLQLNIDSVNKPTFLKNYEIVKKTNEERIEFKKNAPIINHWVEIIDKINKTTEQVGSKDITPQIAESAVKSLIKIKQLNNLPAFASEIKNRIGYSLRGLSIASWNEYNDVLTALNLVELALKINLSQDVTEKLTKDKFELSELKKKYFGIYTCYFCEVNTPDEDSRISKTIYKETSRSWFPTRRVEFSYRNVDIPRCSYCKEIHSKDDGIIGGIKSLFGKSEATKAGIRDNSNNTLSRHPMVEKYFKEGWSFTRPSA